MKFLRRPNHHRLRQASSITRTSRTPPPPHATPAAPAASFSSATRPAKIRVPPSSSFSRTHFRYRGAPLPNTGSIFASPTPPPLTIARMSSTSSTPASTQPAAPSTPSRAPPSGPNHDAAADASHTHPLATGGGSSSSSGGDDPQNQDVDAAAAARGGGDEGGSLPALPAPGSEGATMTLEVDGKAVELDHLGPMVVGRDGTVSRIANWDELSELERRNTLRILGKRNQARLAALRGEEGKAA